MHARLPHRALLPVLGCGEQTALGFLWTRMRAAGRVSATWDQQLDGCTCACAEGLLEDDLDSK